jgi:hypothetical protein
MSEHRPSSDPVINATVRIPPNDTFHLTVIDIALTLERDVRPPKTGPLVVQSETAIGIGRLSGERRVLERINGCKDGRPHRTSPSNHDGAYGTDE